MPRSRIVGLGSCHGDDQAAWLLIDSLRQCSVPDTEVIALAEPTRLLDYLDGCEQLIVIDACYSGQAPGTITRLVWPDPAIQARPGRSSHGFDVAAVLAMANQLGKLPASVVLFGIEAQACEPAGGLSPAVSRALPGLWAQVLCEVRQDS